MTSLKNSLTGKKILSALICASAFSGVAANACTGALDGQTNAVGTHNGYYYSFWTQTQSRVSITCGEGGNYSTDWSGVFNWVGGKGWKPGGPRVVNYSGSFNNGSNQGQSNSYLALYGWTRPPVEVEYYVVESYGSYNPANCGGSGGVAGGGGNGDGQKGSFQSDGATYDVVQCTRTNQPSISGTSTFKQFFSVRNPPKPWGDIQGTITVQNHFDAWQRFGMQLGSDFDYMVLATEGYDGGNNSSGNSNLIITEGGGSNGGGNNGGGNGGDNGGNNGGGDNGGGNNGGGNNGGGNNGGGNNGWDNGGNNGGDNNGGATAGDPGSIVVRARGVVGGEHIDLIVGGNVVAGWDLSTTARDYSYSGNASGEVEVEFTNDSGDLDVVLDYVSVYGDVRQAEDMEYNTAAYDGSCGGGSYTENMHCSGVIGFGDSGSTGGGNAGGNGGFDPNAGGNGGVDPNAGGNGGVDPNAGGNGGFDPNAGGNPNTGGAAGGTCNWYGTSYPMCDTTADGWGWENNQSCISQSTCSSQ